jgi:hypothetical protein
MFLVFEPTTGKLLLAYTTPSQELLKSRPAKNARDAEEAMADRRIAALQTSMLKSKLPEVLSNFWEHTGIDPGEAGQVIVRPRSIDNNLPGREEFLGHRVPTPGFKPWWIIQMLGCPPRLVGVGHREWVMQHLWALLDGELEIGFGTYP